MPRYDWKNLETGEIVEHADPSSPPGPHNGGCEFESESANGCVCTCWQRLYTFGVGKVEGGGGSPARPSVRKDS